MKAAVLRAFDQGLTIEEVAIADPREREVLVRIMAIGVCSSDLSTIRGKTEAALPLIPGHVASGIVERVAAGVSKVKAEDRVVHSKPFNAVSLAHRSGRSTPTNDRPVLDTGDVALSVRYWAFCLRPASCPPIRDATSEVR